MEEKVLIEGQFTNVKNIKKIGIILTFIAGAVTWGRVILGTNISASTDNLITIFVLFLLILFYIMLIVSKIGITVTNKRVFGRALFGKRVDLPIDKVSAVSMCWFKGIGVSTASGMIRFLFCKNRDEVFDCISKILIERQEKPQEIPAVITQSVPQSNADELKKYKDLLDSGVITVEEFEAKKKQLLGL